ncbi:MAG: sugar phosphate isomerase/epimerase [Verrucomicrobiales bacterium]|nr:sugar phosphate isomerase/epimerase [Verrucomicrobiales bacterium]
MKSSSTRRSFLSQSAATLAGASMACAAGEPPKKATSGPSLKGRIFKALKGSKRQKGESLEAFFARLQAIGFDGLESGRAGEAAAYRAASAKTGFRIHGLVNGGHWGVRLSDPNPAVREKGRANLERALMNAHVLGGSSVLLVPGKVNGDKETHEHVWERSIEQVRKVLPLASRIGVRVLIETVWNGFCESPEKFRDYIDDFNSPWVGAYFDIGNMQKFAPAHEWIRVLGNRTVKLDVKDWGKKNGFCRLGEGDVDWDKVRSELKAIDFSGWATREGSDGSIEDTSKLIDELLIGV